MTSDLISNYRLYSVIHRSMNHSFVTHPGTLKGLALTPFNSGRMVGGSIWRLTLTDGSEVRFSTSDDIISFSQPLVTDGDHPSPPPTGAVRPRLVPQEREVTRGFRELFQAFRARESSRETSENLSLREWDRPMMTSLDPAGTVMRSQAQPTSHLIHASSAFRHLNGALLSDQVSNRPALMVAGASGCLWPPVKADRRDEGLLGATTVTGRWCRFVIANTRYIISPHFPIRHLSPMMHISPRSLRAHYRHPTRGRLRSDPRGCSREGPRAAAPPRGVLGPGEVRRTVQCIIIV